MTTLRDGQLLVDGFPYLVVGAEVHNSSSGSAAAIEESFRTVAGLGANTVLVPVTWELLEPDEGEFDFAQVDAILSAARAHDLRVVPLWFGSYKNGMSSYAPGWVKEDTARFPRAEVPGGPIEHLSPFGEATVTADSRAFAELMAYLAREDTLHTVIMVQVENEVGLLGGSRDHSPLANDVFSAQVPPPVIAAVAGHPGTPVHADWVTRGSKSAGTWADVFGDSDNTDELFMACAYAAYVERVAGTGRARLDVPLLVNAWLDGSTVNPGPTGVAGGGRPGDYPSGGPVIRVAPIWREFAPTIDLLCPDFYFGDVRAVCERYADASAGLFIPEMHRTADGVAQMFLAVGEYGAVGVSPFGADSLSPHTPDHGRLADANAMLRMAHQLIRERPGAKRRGFLLDDAAPSPRVQLGDYVLSVELDKRSALEPAYGIVIEQDPGRFVILGRGFTVSFSALDGKVGVRSAQELHWNGDHIQPGRRLNGDETAAGTLGRFPAYGAVPEPLRIPRLENLSGMIQFDLYRF
ncbi:hypothetical protein JOF29_002745 [Kribbella aluminosa]|uniref:Beta-galactosidase n=1 Tax=Kribbella aluminosa TaxID=416017 RepID=A0ABS4UJ23_9ACTN|nr:DUF5597 domain-containing protein [Kribbella aluminosa]MBP2351662.1 hypothetical protein [Kribbella aluminosa]